MAKNETEVLRTALQNLLDAVEADMRTKRGDYYHQRKAARGALANAKVTRSNRDVNARDEGLELAAAMLEQRAHKLLPAALPTHQVVVTVLLALAADVRAQKGADL